MSLLKDREIKIVLKYSTSEWAIIIFVTQGQAYILHLILKFNAILLTISMIHRPKCQSVFCS